MLFYSTIDHELLELLNELMQISAYNSLRLAGGTSLALQIGHRRSVDLDLFGNIDVDKIDLRNQINSIETLVHLKKSKNINIFLVNGIKIDLVNYSYPWLEKPIINNNIRLAGIKDIAAMKIAAITGRGTKKDFIDLYFLLQQFSLKDIFNLYKQKYKDAPEILALKSLSYFDDANNDENPIMIKQVSWEEVKSFIKKTVVDFLG